MYICGVGVMKGISPVLLCVYYEEIKRDLNRRLIYEYRCDERLRVLWGHVPRGGLARTNPSREGDMSWCIMAYDYGIG